MHPATLIFALTYVLVSLGENSPRKLDRPTAALFGSVANVIVAQGAQKQSPLRFVDFLRAGIPITLVTTAAGVLFLWCFQVFGLL